MNTARLPMIDPDTVAPATPALIHTAIIPAFCAPVGSLSPQMHVHTLCFFACVCGELQLLL